MSNQTAVGCLKADEPATWTDHKGREHKTPAGKKLHMARYPLHAALRAYVYHRDGFMCTICGAKALPMPVDPAAYDGFETLSTDRRINQYWNALLVIDHIISRRNGGSNHPSNLQTLCDPCNCAKAALVDSKWGRQWAESAQ
jgi:5-methylcytosine-specific restriction endonuclease McrA